MENSNSNERHPNLLKFTLVTLVMGYLGIVAAIIMFISNNSEVGIYMLPLSLLYVLLCHRVIHVTQYYTRWRSVSFVDKIIGYLMVGEGVITVILTFGLFLLAPSLLAGLSNSVAEGIGIRR